MVCVLLVHPFFICPPSKRKQHMGHAFEFLTTTLKICRVELCTELFYAIIPTSFLCFADLLSLHLVTFYFCSCHFFLAADACLS